MFMTLEQFEASVIAQDDDQDYQEAGYVAGVHEGVAFISRYSHCSCYGTFDALCGGGIGDSFSSGSLTLDWTGTVEELIDMATRIADPVMPDRAAVDSDYDYDHLVKVYAGIRQWAANRGSQLTPDAQTP